MFNSSTSSESTPLNNQNSIEVKNDELCTICQEKEYFIRFDVRFRMVAAIKASSPELAMNKIYEIPERDLLKFTERDAPEITNCSLY